MRRIQSIELHDQPWFPAPWRDHITSFLSTTASGPRASASASATMSNMPVGVSEGGGDEGGGGVGGGDGGGDGETSVMSSQSTTIERLVVIANEDVQHSRSAWKKSIA